MNDQQIYAIMAKTPNIMAVQISDRLDAPLKDVSEMLRGLVEVGEVVAHSGIGPNQRPAQMYNFSDEFKKSRKGLDLIAQAGVAAVADPAPAAAAAPAAGPNVTPVPTPAARRTKVQMAIEYLTTHKVATSAEIRTAMGLAKTSPPTAYLKDAIASGRICRDADRWTLGSGVAPEKKCATGAVSSKPAQGDVENVVKVGNIVVATKDSTVIPDSVLSALESVIVASRAGGDAATAPPPDAKHAPDHAAGRNGARGVPLRGVVGRPDRAAAGRRDRGHADQDRGHAAGGVHPPAAGGNATKERSMSAAIPIGISAYLGADGQLQNSYGSTAADAGGLSICNDAEFVAAMDEYMDAITADERNTDRRVKCRMAIFTAADAWRRRATVMTGGQDDPDVPYTYASAQATNCAGCGQYKHTPLRIDAMGGYVCLTCIDNKLGSLLGEFGYQEADRPDAMGAGSLSPSNPPALAVKNAHDLLSKYCVADLSNGAPATLVERIQELFSWYENAINPTARQRPTASGAVHLELGVSAAAHGTTIVIMQPHTDGSVTTIYSGTHPMGDTVSFAHTVVDRPAANSAGDLS